MYNKFFIPLWHSVEVVYFKLLFGILLRYHLQYLYYCNDYV